MEKQSNNIRIHHARILSMTKDTSDGSSELPVIHGEIHICNDKITYVEIPDSLLLQTGIGKLMQMAILLCPALKMHIPTPA